jgi:OmpA-OmpF porin, OOP family
MWRLPQTSVILGWVGVVGCFVLATVPFVPGSRAQFYIGGEAGWTGLSDQTDTINYMTSYVARFYPGFNTGVRGGYEWGPWRFEEEYSYRRNAARDLIGSNSTVSAAGGDRHSNSIMTNVLYDFTPGYSITPHVGFGVGAAEVVDELNLTDTGQVFNGSSWRFGYQGIAGIRYRISAAFTLDLDYRFFATIEPTFDVPRTNLQYSTYYKTNNFVASVTYRFSPPPPTPNPVSVPVTPPPLP